MNDILLKNNLRVHRFIYENNHHTNKQDGSPFHFFGYLENGTCKYVAGNRVVEVQAGDLVYMPAKLPYHSYWQGSDQIKVLFFGFRYFPEYGNRQYPLQKINCGPEVKALFLRLPTDPAVDSRLWGDFYSAIAAALPFMECRITDARAYLVEQAKQYILQHTDCKISDIARHCLVSERALYNIFQEDLGLTPNELRRQLLCQKAVDMLATTDLSVQSISDALRFSSTSYFRKVLHKYTGKTPRQIRSSTR